MSTTKNGITAFVRYLTFGEDRRDGTRLRKLIPPTPRVNFDIHGREFYSYGRHFPLARFVPAKRGRHAQWLVNGDRWGGGGWSLTNRHQSETRTAIENAIADAAKTGRVIESLIVPFSALDGAGIDRDSLRPIHVRPDRRDTFSNTAKVRRALIDTPLPSRAHCEELSRRNDPRGEHISSSSETLAPSLKLAVSRVNDASGDVDTFARTAKLTRSVLYRGYDHADMHTIEDASMPGGIRELRGGYREYDPPQLTYWLDGSNRVSVSDDGSGELVTLAWTTDRHWLGDSLFTAERVTRRAVRCPSHVSTVNSHTDAVKTGRFEQCETCGHALTDVGTVTRSIAKRSRFLSSFDYNERAPLYFLAALPRTSRARTVDMALEDLAPAAVHAAMARGLTVLRQGDIFAIPTPLTDADISARAVSRSRLTMHTRNGVKPRKGELGYRVPITPRVAAIAAKRKRELFRETMKRHMLADVRPMTPRDWHATRTAKLAEIHAAIVRHAARVAAADNVCDCATGSDGTTCDVCNLPRYYRGYTADNAARGLVTSQADLATWHKESRNRDKGYCSRATYDRKYGRDVCRAANAWQDAKRTVNERFAPSLPFEEIRACLAIHGTGHSATEVAVCARGVTYARGILRHVPAIAGERRGRDHAALPLDGALWYLVIRNTVPRS